jgi:hypothetical protein
MFVPFEDPLARDTNEDGEDKPRKRCMQVILDEIHSMQRQWEAEGGGEWAGAGIINSSKVLIVTVSADHERGKQGSSC